jgi:hypothetical protein
MKKLLLALAAPLALSTPALAETSDYTRGLHAGGAITTCSFYRSGKLDPDFGAFMVNAQFESMERSQQSMLLKLWQQDGSDICIRATYQ